MNKRKLKVLEEAFDAEISGALTGGPRLFQTKSKVAKELVLEGYLKEVQTTIGGRLPVRISGYILTDLGRIAFCESCE